MEYLKYTPEMARDWKNAINYSEGYLRKRVLDSMNESQLVSKLWLIEELSNLNVRPVNISLLAGWFSQYIIPLLFDNFKTIEWIENFEMDGDIKKISYLSNNFACKEALSKALGLGFSEGITYKDLEILRDKKGAPKINLSERANNKAQNLGVKIISLNDLKGI